MLDTVNEEDNLSGLSHLDDIDLDRNDDVESISSLDSEEKKVFEN